jgi:hypothetical protein
MENKEGKDREGIDIFNVFVQFKYVLKELIYYVINMPEC